MAQPNYNDNEVTKLKDMYSKLGNKGLDEIAKELGKTVPSVRSKLIRENVYVPEEKKPARKNGPTKKELHATLREITGCELNGVMGATKEALLELITLFEEKKKDGKI